MSAQEKTLVKIGKNAKTANADSLIREYKQTRWLTNSERIGKPDSLSAWYSIEEMEKFLALAKSHGGDGIKFYYGAYTENYNTIPEFAGRQTLVTVATKSKMSETGTRSNKDIYLTKNGQTKILCGLDPSICPPYCSPRIDGGMGDLGITIIDKGEGGMEIL